MHHVDTEGTNNEAFILVVASGRPTHNVIMGNHFHHIGILDQGTGAVTDYGGVNVGCIYTETRQSYDSPLPDPGTNPDLQDYLDALLPADSHTYIYNNYGHHCAMGFATKNAAQGPFFFLSNVAHDVRTGIKNSYTESIIRNNIVFAGAGDVSLGTGIRNGNPNHGTPNAFFDDITNAAGSEITYNTVVGADNGIYYLRGWSVTSSNNLIIDTAEPIHIHRNQYAWYDNGDWPGIRGEYILSDLGPANPYYSIMPGYLQEMEGTFLQLSTIDNCYDTEPVIAPADFTQPENEIAGRVPDQNYAVISAAEKEQLFEPDTYVRDRTNALFESCGSRATLQGSMPVMDGGMGGATLQGSMPVMDGGMGGPDGSTHSASESGGCGCRSTGRRPGLFLVAFLLGVFLCRRRRT
jgi:hypothetical protein